MYICLHDKTCDSLISNKLVKQYLEEHEDLNIGIIYKEKEDYFVDIKGNIVSIEGKTIIPYTGVYQIEELIKSIKKHDGIPIISKESLSQTSNWPNAYKTKRKMQIVKGKDLLDDDFIKYIEEHYGKQIFFKTVNKDYSSILKVDFLKDDESLVARTLKHHLNDLFIISEKLEILEDDKGLLEYRCFVINKSVINVSRITDSIMHKIDKNVLDETKKIIDAIDYEKFPDSFVVDICFCTNANKNFFDVVEFNSISSSGTYLYNTLLSFDTTNILHDDITIVAPEKQKYLPKLVETGKINIIPSKLFDAPGSFSNTLKKIRLNGHKDGYFHISGVKLDDNDIKDDVLGAHGSLYGNIFGSIKFVDSESSLSKLDDEARKK